MKLKYKVLILFGAASLVITAALGTVLYRQLLEDRLLAVRDGPAGHVDSPLMVD